ncbi:MAG: alpha-1,4-glucan--maltose-1-phosphate maltosyltransferase [Xanthobacteraceae bacterium]
MSMIPPVNKSLQVAEDVAIHGPFHIEDIYPQIDGGRFPVKRIGGEPIEVWADIFRGGHDVTRATLLWRREDDGHWQRTPMRHHDNDRWTATFTPDTIGRYQYAIEARTDAFASWRHGTQLKQDAGLDVTLDAHEGAALLAQAQATGEAAAAITRRRDAFLKSGDIAALLADDLADIMADSLPASDLTRTRGFPLVIDRPRARYGAWYEIFPRSQGTMPDRHGTFRDCITRLPDIAAMGFDVVYLTPIHPIGRTNRKGRNNAVTAAPGDPGSPYAIGNAEGGHDAIHPELGTLDDFRDFVRACRALDMEVALDFAVQCSPDHPWLSQHPDWFRRRPDGSMRYAENPPKKYEDIVNPDFECADVRALWRALRDIVLFWIDQDVRIFRVDNPHTKPFDFWEWLIHEVQARHPDVIFLSEAFTRPKPMKALAKRGFTQSYTYFTWRTGKWEIEDYLRELTGFPERDYYRPNFFTNTPDILPFHLQSGEPWLFKARLALAAMLSGNYGIYNGFELIEHTPIPGKEEYLDSEKYEIKVRNWDQEGNIKPYIAAINRARRAHPALQQTASLRFLAIDDGNVTAFVKQAAGGGDTIVVAIALSPEPREVWLPMGDIEIATGGGRGPVAALENILTQERHPVEWGGARVRIEPLQDPALLLRCLA